MNTLTASSFICAVAALAFGIVISSKSLKDKRYRWFAIFCGLIALWNLCFFLSQIFYSILFERLHLLITLLLGPCFLYFFIQLIHPTSGAPARVYSNGRFSRLFMILGMIGTILITGLFLPIDQLFWFKYSANLYSTVLAGYAFYLFIQHCRHSKLGSHERRKQLYFIATGMVTLASLIMDGFSENFPLPSIGNALLVLYLYFIYQTITKQKVLDLEDLTAKGVLFFVLAAILTFIYATLVAWVEGPILFIFNTFVASFVILILFEPIKSLVERTTSEFFLKGKMTIEKKLEQINTMLLETTDIRDLTHTVVVGLKEALAITQAHFFLLDREGTKFKLIKSLEPDPSKIKVTEIPIHHHFIKYLQRTHPKVGNTYSIQREILEGGRSAPKEKLEQTLQLFQSLNAEGAFAFILDKKMLGLCSFINEKSEAPFSLKDLELLIPFSKQIALSIKNLEIYDQIRQRDRLATIGEMAAGLAHEIKNPLGAIKGAAQYLQPSQELTHQNEFLKIIVDEVDRLNTVVTSFLNYAKPLEHALTETDLGELLKETLQTLSPNQRSDIHITTNLDPKTPFALVDPAQMKQVFLNLLLNAIQSMPEGGPINISLRNEKNETHIVFEDSGVGISPEDQKKLFIPFYTTREGGSGLGLPICQKIIRAHGGDIKIESELRKGTKFIIILPHAWVPQRPS